MPVDTPRVRVLRDAIANQIAAGEVVERPASVVKELVENALDAGAARIKVEVIGGGQRSLRVTDDGHGMIEADARTAFRRHGTSKLSDAADLATVATLGFRGEALPSIASVSRLELTTAVEGAEQGTRIRIEGGGPLELEAAPPVRGTSVVVEDLFFNTPARRKFLKRPTTELSHISDVVARLALAHPAVGFKLLAEGRSVLDAPPAASEADARLRLSRLLGKTVADACRPLEDDGLTRLVRVRGFFGVPPLCERGSRGQHVFVNGRFVRDRTITSAIVDAYQGRLPKGRQPVVILFVDLDPSEVDVNVHPQKTEVRFARPGEIFRAVQAGLRRGLLGLETRPIVSPETRRRALGLAGDVDVVRSEPRTDPQPGTAPTTNPMGQGSGEHYRGHGRRLLGAFAAEAKRLSRYTSPRVSPDALSAEPSEALESGGPSPASAPPERIAPPAPGGRTAAARAFGPWPSPRQASLQGELPMPRIGLSAARRVGVVLSRYLVLEAEGAMWLADLASIGARVTTEAAARRPLGPPQALLLPLELACGGAGVDRWEAAASALAEVGFDVRVLPREHARLHAAPAGIGDLDLEALATIALDAFENEEPIEGAVRAAVAEGRATRPGRTDNPTEPAEVEALLEALERCEIRDRSPDGRPLVVALGAARLEALFGGSG